MNKYKLSILGTISNEKVKERVRMFLLESEEISHIIYDRTVEFCSHDIDASRYHECLRLVRGMIDMWNSDVGIFLGNCDAFAEDNDDMADGLIADQLLKEERKTLSLNLKSMMEVEDDEER